MFRFSPKLTIEYDRIYLVLILNLTRLELYVLLLNTILYLFSWSRQQTMSNHNSKMSLSFYNQINKVGHISLDSIILSAINSKLRVTLKKFFFCPIEAVNI